MIQQLYVFVISNDVVAMYTSHGNEELQSTQKYIYLVKIKDKICY